MRKEVGKMRQKIIFLVGFFLLAWLSPGLGETAKKKPAGKTGSQPIAVTSVQVKTSGSGEKTAEIVVDNAILIKEIKLLKENSEKTLVFPTYLSRRGKEYPQVKILSKDAYQIIEQAILTEKPSEVADKQYTLSYKITRFSPYNQPSSARVFCAVAINGAIEIECRVMEGNYGPWIAWPARKSEETGSYIKQVIITNEALRQAIEKALLKKYQDLRREKGTTRDDENSFFWNIRDCCRVSGIS